MKLARFMDEAYQGAAQSKKLKTRMGKMIFSLEDLADLVGDKPTRAEVEAQVPCDWDLLSKLISTEPARKHQLLWGYLGSILAERSAGPLQLASCNYAGLELRRGTIILQAAGDHVGERMTGGRIFIRGPAGDYLGQEMSGGGIVTQSCKDYAFRNMRGGFGVVLGTAGNFACLGKHGGRTIVRGDCGARAGWLMHGGNLRIGGDAGEYLGILMSGGKILVRGRTGKRAGWRMKGGIIQAASFGPETDDGVMELAKRMA